MQKLGNILNDTIGRSNKNCNVSNEIIINNSLTVDKQQCIANSIHHGILIYNLDDGIQSKTDTMLVILDTSI